MTAVSGGVPRNASDKTQCYERLRARILEARRPPVAVVSAGVLVRQGMSTWMQLDDSQSSGIEPRTRHSGTELHRADLPAPRHCELLAVLTSLVFNICSQKESA